MTLKSRFIRIALTIILLYFVWTGNQIALYIAVTLSAISMELQVLINERNNRHTEAKEVWDRFKDIIKAKGII